MLLSTRGPYCLYVYRDHALPDMHTKYPGVRIVCFADAQSFGDSHPFIESDQLLRQLYMDAMGQNVRGAKAYERVADWSYVRDRTIIDGATVQRTLVRTIQRKFVILPLAQTDTGNIEVMSHVSFPLPDRHVGWIYADKEEMLQRNGFSKFNKGSHEVIKNYLKQMVANTNLCRSGKCYGYELYRCGRYIIGSDGLLGEPSEVLKAIEDVLPSDCAGMTKCLEKC